MRDIERREVRLTESYWDCGAAGCPTRHESSATAQRCPHRVRQVRDERRAELAQQPVPDLMERLAAVDRGCRCSTDADEHELHNTDCLYRLAREAHGRIAEMEQTFRLRWDADMRAIQRWREQDPRGRELRQPDHADLVVWLLGHLQETDQDAYDRAMDQQFEGYDEQ